MFFSIFANHPTIQPASQPARPAHSHSHSPTQQQFAIRPEFARRFSSWPSYAALTTHAGYKTARLYNALPCVLRILASQCGLQSFLACIGFGDEEKVRLSNGTTTCASGSRADSVRKLVARPRRSLASLGCPPTTLSVCTVTALAVANPVNVLRSVRIRLNSNFNPSFHHYG